MRQGLCGADPLPTCESYCLCEIEQLEGADLSVCQNTVTPPLDLYGYCYVDADQGIGNSEIVEDCPPTGRRLLRFVGDDTPTNRSIAFISCTGAPLGPAP